MKEKLNKIYILQRHEEGGWYLEVYTSPFTKDGRPMAGSICFLLDGEEISHFHQIDCMVLPRRLRNENHGAYGHERKA